MAGGTVGDDVNSSTLDPLTNFFNTRHESGKDLGSFIANLESSFNRLARIGRVFLSEE